MKRSYSRETPGFTLAENSTEFCFYCPAAERVECFLFNQFDDEQGQPHTMTRNARGYWHLQLPGRLSGRWYGYRVDFGENPPHPPSPYEGKLFADPYSRHVTVLNNYRQEAKSYIFEDEFDWQGTTHCFPDDPRDLIIYETHLKDLTAHPSGKAQQPGFYRKFVESGQTGGLTYLKRLGVNCVEFLPLQKFSPLEPPFGKTTSEGFHNSWNVYASNYWGYMTSFFFAPETSFASDLTHHHAGNTTAAVTEFKEMVRALHQENITVLMDVVYNHTSLFDMNPLTHLCPDEYLRYDEEGTWSNRSGTGNEFRSENPVARQMIIDSLLWWMEEYQIDGFRFDLAALLDRKTWDVIRTEIHKHYPNAVLIAEPWGGYYSPHHFSDHDWASWNDRIRNSIKGSDPMHDRGFIFSDWQHETRRERLENIMRGTLNNGEGGLYNTSRHTVNYLESHDGYTLGDFIRIGLKPELQEHKITDRKAHIKLDEEQMRIAKLAALCLFTAQGMTMIHAGQEFARSKIIAKTPCDDPEVGTMDHNSYQKDNETNWINFDDIPLNAELFEYYRALILIRQESPALRKCAAEEICFEHFGNPLILRFYISGESSGDLFDYYVVLNADTEETEEVSLPTGSWEVIVNQRVASLQAIDIVSQSVHVPPQSGALLRKLRR